jgi:hypothetical protein
MRLWDITTGETIQTYAVNTPVESVALFKDFTRWAYGTNQRTAGFTTLSLLPDDSVPDLQSESTAIDSLVTTSNSGTGTTSSNAIVGLLTDGKTLLMSNGEAVVSELASTSRYTLGGQRDSVTSIATSANLLVTGSDDNTAYVWHINPGDGLHGGEKLQSISNDGRYAILDSGGYIALDQPASPITDDESVAVGFSPDSQSVLWDTGTGFELRAIQSNDLISKFDLSSNPKYKGDRLTLNSFSPDGKLVMLTGDGYGLVVNVMSGAILVQYTGFSGGFSPDGRYFFARVQTGNRLFKAATGEDVTSQFPADALADPQFSADGKYMGYVSGDKNSSAVLLDATTGKEVRRLPLTGGDFRFSPDSKSIVDAGPFRSLDVETGTVIRTFTDRLTYSPDNINQVSFSSDGKLMMTVSDLQLDIWDTTTGQRIRQFAADGTFQSNAHFLPDGKSVAVSVDKDNDTNTLVVPIDFQVRLSYACSRLTGDLTDAERTQYGIKDSDPTCPPAK